VLFEVYAFTDACLTVNESQLVAFVTEKLKLPEDSLFHVYVCHVITPAELTVRIVAEEYSVSFIMKMFARYMLKHFSLPLLLLNLQGALSDTEKCARGIIFLSV
jgi:hypothetical protein